MSNSLDIVKKTLIVSHAVEKTGHYYSSNQILSVGFCIGDASGAILEKRIFNIAVTWPTVSDGRVSYGDFDPAHWNAFWATQSAEARTKYVENSLEPKLAWYAIASYIDYIAASYSDTHKIIFVANNVLFNTAAIDFCLDIYAQRKPMRFLTTCCQVYDLVSVMSLIKIEDQSVINAKAKINNQFSNLADTAQYNLLRYIMSVQHVTKG